MELGVSLPKGRVKDLLAGVLEVKEIKETKGGSLVITDPLLETAAVRSELEKRLGQGAVHWLR